MKNTASLIKKWRDISIEKKVIAGWIFSLIIVLSISAILYFSKQELRQSSNVIVLNSELRIATQDLLSSIQKLEIVSKSFVLTGNRLDSTKYFADLDSLRKNLKRLERLINNHPRFVKYFLPLEKTIREELYRLNHLSFSLKHTKLLDLEIIRIEDNIYKKLDNYWQLLDDEEEQVTLEQIQAFHSKLERNLNYFLALILVYIVLLTALFLIIILDVKKRRKLTAEIGEKRKELDSILNTAPAFIFVKNLEKKFTLVNQSFLEFFKVDKENILLNNNKRIISKNEKWLADEEDEAVIHNKIALKNIERKIALPDGRSVWLNINKAPLYDDKNDVIGIVGVMDDITQRIEFHEKLMAAQKEMELLNKQKDKFFSIIAHDLRSPFSGMLGFAEILIDDYAELSEDDKKFYIQGIYSSLKDLLTLIDNLLTWSRVQLNRVEFDPQEISLRKIVDSVFSSQKIAANNKQIKLESEISTDIKAYADADMIETVIRNLVSNSIKFTNGEGVIIVKAATDGDFVKVEIADNGVGMKKEIADKLFKIDTQVTTKGTKGENGTGLGLIICKEFVEKHGGTISVESEVGKGTTISFNLPEH
ncbi:MAG: ATP-binding protein [Bacteroidetes bacterium]|nr:ATP-binding protein [Bacteroidota bacterium]MCL6098760.1 ATP-binding protein [Bacteroidota bacterium]